MKLALTIILGFVALVAMAVLGLYVAGSRLPREHHSQITITLRASCPKVWTLLTDYQSMPNWWPAVKAVRVEKLRDGTELTWNQDRHGQKIPFRTVESRPNERLVRAIASDQLSYGGTWTYELHATGAGFTRLTLIEDGFIDPPIFRALANWFIDLDRTQRDFLDSLQRQVSRMK
jgi:uncharacterized protein YndB with AHSA1/START domain